MRRLAVMCLAAWSLTGPAVQTAAQEAPRPMHRTIDRSGFQTLNGERFWSRPLYGPNRRCFVPTGELPHAAFLWFHPKVSAYVRCGHLLPGIINGDHTRWLCEAAQVQATYDPGMMRFTVQDPACEGEIVVEVVPLAEQDGYMMRLRPTRPVRLAFAFGGFWSMKDKDILQGNSVLPGGILADQCRGSSYQGPQGGITRCSVPTIADQTEKTLDSGLSVYLLSDRDTTASLHEARDGIGLRELITRAPAAAPVQVHEISLNGGEALHLAVVVPRTADPEAEPLPLHNDLGLLFASSVKRVHEIAGRVNLATPDTLVDLGARSLSVSMDALWVPPTFMHGPIRWGWSGLAGWRMAYGADICGTPERAAAHCMTYGGGRHRGGLDRKPHADPRSLLTRQAGDSLAYSEGRLSTGVYNMTEMWLSFIAHHYDWTGDREFLRTMWPAIRDAVAYQKRALDMDNDSLYENYANTYITDAHWHSGAGCTQASAYTYRANLLAAEAARIVGESPAPYLAEAARIKQALDQTLWVREKGVYAEFKDVLGEKLRHEDPELGSVYLPIDFGVADEFQAYQMLRFTEWGLPNHEFREVGSQPFESYLYPHRQATYEFPEPMRAREVKSSNWRPIILTVFECSPGELMDTARCYQRLGYGDRAFPLLKSVLRCMVNLTTPGGLVIRDRNGETWARSWGTGDVDHCDTLGPSLQCLAEGLFGLRPRMAEDRLEIQPSFPSDWDHARIELRDVEYSFTREGQTDTFTVQTTRPTTKRLRLVMRGDGATASVNGQAVAAAHIVPGIGHAFIEVEAPQGTEARFSVSHSTRPLPEVAYPPVAASGMAFTVTCHNGAITEVKDPQGVFGAGTVGAAGFTAPVTGALGHHTAFVHVKGAAVDFWQPVDIEVREPLELAALQLSGDAHSLAFALQSNAAEPRTVQATVSCAGQQATVAATLAPHSAGAGQTLALPAAAGLVPGSNPVVLSLDGKPAARTHIECWDLLRRDPARKAALQFEPVDISPHFNEDLALVHTREFVSPRSPYCSLEPGIDLFREWCSAASKPCGPLDLGVLKAAVARGNGVLATEPGVPFRSSADGKNIVFVSQWDNYPRRVSIPVGRAARHVYLLMASVTNPMQSGVVNGRVVLALGGGRQQVLELVNPRNLSWFCTSYPNRYGPLFLVQPTVKLGESAYATIYSMPLAGTAEVTSLTVEAVCNESVIGLMGVTLLAP